MSKLPWIWALGIEDTFIHAKNPLLGKTLDEYELTDHYRRWKEDIDLLTGTGISAMRWGIPWYRIEKNRGDFDFSWPERVVDYMLGKGVEPILDLVHYGTPDWMEGSFLHPDYPQYIREYTQATLETFADRVSMYTPNNEPYTAALFCGPKGQWPPYGSDYASFAKIMVQIVKGVIPCSHDIRDAGNTNIHVEVATASFTQNPRLKKIDSWNNALQTLYWDLILGSVTEEHQLYPWLLESGISKEDLTGIAQKPAAVDIMGLNFYPQFSISEIVGNESNWNLIPFEVSSEEFSDLVKRYWDQYQIPLMVTETSVKGSDSLKCKWLDESIAVLKELKKDSVDIAGYTWFPAIDMIDWSYQIMPGTPDEFPIHLGIWDIDRSNTDANPVEMKYTSLINDHFGE